jgi:hypothetical protein
MGLRFFCGHARLALQMSTVIRMNYLCQPIAGLLFITVNFFQDGSNRYHLQFRLDVQFSALVHNFNFSFLNRLRFQTGHSMNSSTAASRQRWQ